MSKFTFDAGIDDERIQTLQMYLKKKDTTIEEKLIDGLDKLYQSTVPQQVREFLDERQGLPSVKPAPKQTRRKQQPQEKTDTAVANSKAEEGGIVNGAEQHPYPHSNT